MWQAAVAWVSPKKTAEEAQASQAQHATLPAVEAQVGRVHHPMRLAEVVSTVEVAWMA